MDVREKLVELIDGVQHYGTICTMSQMDDRYASITQVSNTEVAERLIAHGVTVQERGEWVYDHWCEFKCSVCGEFSNSKPYKGKEKYCPNCGAKMVPKPPKEE